VQVEVHPAGEPGQQGKPAQASYSYSNCNRGLMAAFWLARSPVKKYRNPLGNWPVRSGKRKKHAAPPGDK